MARTKLLATCRKGRVSVRVDVPDKEPVESLDGSHYLIEECKLSGGTVKINGKEREIFGHIKLIARVPPAERDMEIRETEDARIRRRSPILF